MRFGIRPEPLTGIRPNDHFAAFEAVEPVGIETLLHVWMRGNEICARVCVTPGRAPV